MSGVVCFLSDDEIAVGLNTSGIIIIPKKEAAATTALATLTLAALLTRAFPEHEFEGELVPRSTSIVWRTKDFRNDLHITWSRLVRECAASREAVEYLKAWAHVLRSDDDAAHHCQRGVDDARMYVRARARNLKNQN